MAHLQLHVPRTECLETLFCFTDTAIVNVLIYEINIIKEDILLFHTHLCAMYEGVSKSFRNHQKVKEPEMSFLYLIHKTSLKSHFAKLHIPPTLY